MNNQNENIPETQTLAKIEEFNKQLISEYKITQSELELVRDTVCKGCTFEEMKIFFHVSKKTGLDPFAKQIYAVKRKDNNLGKDVMSIQTGIDGYRLVAERTEKYSPGKEPEHKYDKEGKIFSSTAYIKKMTKDGTWHEVSATAHYSEYVQLNKSGMPTSFWFKMPHQQLAKCAEALALRKAFPMELSGVYTSEEMQQSKETEEEILRTVEVIVDNTPQKKFNEPQIQINTLQKEESLSKEQLDLLLGAYAKTDSAFKKNFRDHMIKEWKAHEFHHIEKKYFDMAMQGIYRNIEKNQNIKL